MSPPTTGRGRPQPPLPTGHQRQVSPRWRLPSVVHRCVHMCAEAVDGGESARSVEPGAGNLPGAGMSWGAGPRTISACGQRNKRGARGEVFDPDSGVDCRGDPLRRTLGRCSRAVPCVARRAPGPHLVVARAFEEAMREEDVSTEQPQAKQEARVSPADAQQGRSRRSPSPPGQGPLPPVGLIWPIRERSTFRALAQGRRRRRGVVMVTCAVVGPRSEPPRVAYAIGRAVGGAVVRNRVRRRLRVATRASAGELLPGCAYLVSASAAASRCSFDELSASLDEALRALGESSS